LSSELRKKAAAAKVEGSVRGKETTEDFRGASFPQEREAKRPGEGTSLGVKKKTEKIQKKRTPSQEGETGSNGGQKVEAAGEGSPSARARRKSSPSRQKEKTTATIFKRTRFSQGKRGSVSGQGSWAWPGKGSTSDCEEKSRNRPGRKKKG